MAHNPHHEHLIKEVEKMFKDLLKNSPQAIYIYLDDEHKICNEKLAKMVGYKNSKEWVKNPYPLDDVAEKDQKKAIRAYMQASGKFKASTQEFTMIKKNGKKVKVSAIISPFTYGNEVFVIYFINKK